MYGEGVGKKRIYSNSWCHSLITLTTALALVQRKINSTPNDRGEPILAKSIKGEPERTLLLD